MIKLIGTLFFCVSFLHVRGQQLVTGRVLDDENKKGIKEAYINDGDTTVISNFLGFFQIEADSSKTLYISAPNYEPGTVKIPNNNFTVLLKPSPEEIFLIVEDPARPPNGYDDFEIYLQKSFLCNGAKEGQMLLNFVTNKQGEIKEVAVIQNDLDKGCEPLLISALSNAPRWKPAAQRGIAVSQRHRLGLSINRGKVVRAQLLRPNLDPHSNLTFFLMRNLNYPERLKGSSLSMELYLVFEHNAETRGITNLQIIDCADEELRTELVRVFNSLPYEIVFDLYPTNTKLIQPLIFSFNSNPPSKKREILPEGSLQKDIVISYRDEKNER